MIRVISIAAIAAILVGSMAGCDNRRYSHQVIPITRSVIHRAAPGSFYGNNMYTNMGTVGAWHLRVMNKQGQVIHKEVISPGRSVSLYNKGFDKFIANPDEQVDGPLLIEYHAEVASEEQLAWTRRVVLEGVKKGEASWLLEEK